MARRQPTPAQVLKAISKLRECYELGRQLLEDHGRDVKRWIDLKSVCERFDLPAYGVRTLRKFAATYTESDLERLCRQCEQHSRVVGMTVLRHLTKFHDRRKRARFQERLVAEGWGNMRIKAELKRSLRPTWNGGRKPDIAQDVFGVLLQLQGFAVAWRRWSERLADLDDDEVNVRPADLARKVRAAMATITNAFVTLSAEVSRQMEHAEESHRTTSRGRRTNAKSQTERP
jgi:hypothetical protein